MARAGVRAHAACPRIRNAELPCVPIGDRTVCPQQSAPVAQRNIRAETGLRELRSGYARFEAGFA